MKYIGKTKAKKVNIGAGDVLEYNFGDSDIDAAIATINGKYPTKGYVVNEECKELLHVISGTGKIITKDKTVELSQGDQVLIDKGELFKYEGAENLVVLAVCTPAWRPEQHKAVDG